MSGRSLMVAVAFSALALAIGAGCASESFAASSQLSNFAAPANSAGAVSTSTISNPALKMALATEEAEMGPTPTMEVLTGESRRGFTTVVTREDKPMLNVSYGPSLRNSFGPSAGLAPLPSSGEYRPLELSFSAPIPNGFDVEVSRRTGSAQGPNGSAVTQGAEVRIGKRLMALAPSFKSPDSWRKPTWYVFAASDGQALVYTPSTDPTSLNRNFTTQDRIKLGSIQAGVAIEARGMQASFSYVKREITTLDLIREKQTQDDDFLGFTFTYRR